MDQEQQGYEAAFDANAQSTETPPVAGQSSAQEVTEQPEYVQLKKDEYDRIINSINQIPELSREFQRKLDSAAGKIGSTIEELRRERAAGNLSDDDIAPFKDDLPELYSVLKKVRTPSSMDLEPLIAQRAQPLIEQATRTITDELRETQQAAVEMAHPDWQEFTSSPEFNAWLQTKDEDYRVKLANTWSPKLIISAISEAKKAKPAKSNARQDVMQAAITPRGTGRVTKTGESEIDGYMSAWS